LSLIVISTCKCNDCDVENFPNFFIQKKKKFITTESIKNDQFIYLNGNQIFDQNLLIDFDQQLIQNTVSFEGYTNAYNAKIQVIKEREKQQPLSITNNNCDM
jgi:hypothetical protein